MPPLPSVLRGSGGSGVGVELRCEAGEQSTRRRPGLFGRRELTRGRLTFSGRPWSGCGGVEAQCVQVSKVGIHCSPFAAGVTHIDTSDCYGPPVVNELIREALAPLPADLVLVTMVGAGRGGDASWNVAASADGLLRAVEDNLRTLGRTGWRWSISAPC